MKRQLLSILMWAMALGAFAQAGIITSPPEGTLHSTVYGSSARSFLVTQGAFGSISQNCGYCTRIVIDGNDFYIHNIIREYSGIDSWVKGTRDQAGNVVFKFPQPVATDPANGETLYASMMVAKSGDSGIDLVSDTEIPNLILSWDGTTLKQILPGSSTGNNSHYDGMIGLINAAGTFKAYGETDVSYTIVTEKPAAPAEGIATKSYTANYQDQWKDSYHQLVKIAYDGNTAWLQGLCQQIPEAWVKGTVNDDRSITIPSKQYLGIANDYFYYFYGADNNGLSSGQTYAWADGVTLKPVAADNLSAFNAESAMMINLGCTRPWFGLGMASLTLSEIIQGDPIPANPEFGDPEWDANEGLGVADVLIHDNDINGNSLDHSNLYYRVYFDGELATVAYGDNDTPLTDIPFGKAFDLVLYEYGWHFIIFLEPLKTIGVQAVYKTDGKEYCSDVVTHTFVEAGIDNIVTGDITKTEYYSLTGIKLSNPCGLCIMRSTHADGTVTTSKVYVR